MTAETHSQLASFIWGICNLLRGPYKRNEYRWIIENDWLEAIVALPEQLFYNTGLSTYLWVLTNRKGKPRKGKVQLIDARHFWVQMEKSLGNKRRRIGDPSDKERDPNHIGELTKIFGNFRDGETRTFTEEDPITHQPVQRQRVVCKVFDNEDFGYYRSPSNARCG